MEPAGSFPHSQVPADCPYPVPARSSPYPYIPLTEDPSQYYPPIYAWVFQVVSFPQILQAVDRSIRTINTTGAAKCILQLPHRWQRVVHNVGDYTEGQ